MDPLVAIVVALIAGGAGLILARSQKESIQVTASKTAVEVVVTAMAQQERDYAELSERCEKLERDVVKLDEELGEALKANAKLRRENEKLADAILRLGGTIEKDPND